MKKLNYPFDEKQIRALKVGDMVMISGKLFTGRDAVHKYLHEGGKSPVNLKNQIIYHCGPVVLEKGGKYDAIVIDDFSFLAEQTMSSLEKRVSGFTLFKKLRDSVLNFRNAARYANAHVILNCWSQAPKTRADGSYVRGGPMLSGKLPEQMPAMCDLVLQCAEDQGRQPWKGTYKCEFSSQYVMKDRFGLCYSMSPAPMNLGEILRKAGYNISRLSNLSWQEEVVEKFSHDLEQAQDVFGTANTLYGQLLAKGIDHRAARWTLRDALDRMTIRRALSTQNARFV